MLIIRTVMAQVRNEFRVCIKCVILFGRLGMLICKCYGRLVLNVGSSNTLRGVTVALTCVTSTT